MNLIGPLENLNYLPFMLTISTLIEGIVVGVDTNAVAFWIPLTKSTGR